MNQSKILIVEDESIIALELEIRLQTKGYQNISKATTGEQAIIMVKVNIPDVVIMDIKLSGEMNGIEAAEEIYNKYKIPIIYLTGNSHLISNTQLQKTHPVEVISKPASDWQMISAIEKALKLNE